MGTKGKIEEAVKTLGFDRVSVYRPGLLITPREETRLLEKCAQTLVPFLDRGSSKSISGLTMNNDFSLLAFHSQVITTVHFTAVRDK